MEPGSLAPATAQTPTPSPTPTLAPAPATLSKTQSPGESPPSTTAPSLPQQSIANEKSSAKSDPPASATSTITVNGVEFHHASEAEFARLLDYYGIEWQYEPNQFPLQWHEGRPTEMFSPDFYLTEYDMYIELTTMRQSLVRRKNRKLRLLRALYPEINIKLLYRRDYNRLLERFGIKPDEMEAEQPPQEEREARA